MRLPAWPRERIELQVKNIAWKEGRPGVKRRIEAIERQWAGGSQEGEGGFKPTEQEQLWYDLLKRVYDELPTSRETLGFDMDNERKRILHDLAQRKRVVLSPRDFQRWAKNVKKAV